MVYVLLADGFEEIEALTVVDVLRRADIETQTVSIRGEIVTGAHEIKVIADTHIDKVDIKQVSMIVLPGGMPGTTNLENNERVQQLTKDAINEEKYLAAICAAPMILGKMGYLKGRKAICFPGFEKYLKGAVIKDSRVNIDSKIITSKGAGTALDFALMIVSVLKDEDTAHKLRIQMQC